MEYEPVENDDPMPEVLRIQRQRRAMYACFTVFVVTKLLVVCWIITMSFPSDAFSRLFQGDWADDQD